MQQYTKDPEATKTYMLDWSVELTALGETVTIDESEWAVPQPLVVIENSHENTSVSIKIGGGKANANYTLYNKIITSTGDTDRKAILIQVRNAATFIEPSEFEEALVAVRAVMIGAATKNQKRYSIANRQLERYSMEELIALESRLVKLVNQQRLTAALKNGVPLIKRVRTRFR